MTQHILQRQNRLVPNNPSRTYLTVCIPLHWAEMIEIERVKTTISQTDTIKWGFAPFLERQIADDFDTRPAMIIEKITDKALVTGEQAIIRWLVKKLGYIHSIWSPDYIPDEEFEDIDSDVVIFPRKNSDAIIVCARHPETIALLAIRYPEMSFNECQANFD